MEWQPKLSGPGPIHRRLASCLRRDIESGVLQAGQRLPPQRILADRLRMSVGTVTKAFQEAERLGLVTGQVGRGTFVRWLPERAAESANAAKHIDLSVNITPCDAAATRFGETLLRLGRRPNVADLTGYAPPAGFDAHRKAAATWLARSANFAADWSRLIMTAGGQHAMTLAFAALCAPGDDILCEAATYYGFKALAEQEGYRLHGVAMDEEGILPAAFAEAAGRTGARTAYLMPTAQVPTARSMGAQRRQDIIDVARRQHIRIVEDDNYPLFGPAPGLAPLAHMAPDICIYIGSVSKSLLPGLRTGFLVAPTQDMQAAIVRALRSTIYASSAFGPFVMAEWVEDGSAFEIAGAMVKEVTARCALANEMLNPDRAAPFPVAPHVWLNLGELETERAAGRAQRAGVTVTPPELPILDSTLISGLRLCLGAPASRADLMVGLTRLAAALDRTQDLASGKFI